MKVYIFYLVQIEMQLELICRGILRW